MLNCLNIFGLLLVGANFFFIKCQTYTINNLAVCGKRINAKGRDLKIVNGNPATPGDYPWQVCIMYVVKLVKLIASLYLLFSFWLNRFCCA